MKIKLLGVMVLSACFLNAYAGNAPQTVDNIQKPLVHALHQDVKHHTLENMHHSDHKYHHHKTHHHKHHNKHHHHKHHHHKLHHHKHHHGDHKHHHHTMMNTTLQNVALADASNVMNTKENIVTNKQEAGGKIMHVLVVADKGEIAAAREALKKSSNKEVKSYAQMMLKQHSDNLEKTMVIMKKFNIKPVDSHISSKLEVQGKEALKTLQSLHGTAFDKKYMSDMVQDHKQVLMVLTNMDKEAKSAAVKDHLDTTIKHVKMHLKKAEDIRV